MKLFDDVNDVVESFENNRNGKIEFETFKVSDVEEVDEDLYQVELTGERGSRVQYMFYGYPKIYIGDVVDVNFKWRQGDES